MASRPRKPNPIREALNRAHALDLRRQQQIQNQINSLTRLVAEALKPEDERSPDAVAQEMATLNEQLADEQVRRGRVEDLLNRLEGDGEDFVAIDDVRRAIAGV